MSSPQQCSDSDFNLRSSLWECRDQDLFTDISLVCNRGQNQQIIRGHKIIFAASSTYLSKMMSQQALDLPDVDFRVLQDLVKFIYTGQAPISEPEFENFVELGGKLSVKGIPNFKINTDPSDLAENEAALPEENPRDRKRRTDGVEQSGSTSFEPDVNPLGASTNDSEESNFGLSNLPNEVLLRIFSYVPTFDLLANVARVSKQFYKLTKDRDAHKSITFTDHVNMYKNHHDEYYTDEVETYVDETDENHTDEDWTDEDNTKEDNTKEDNTDEDWTDEDWTDEDDFDEDEFIKYLSSDNKIKKACFKFLEKKDKIEELHLIRIYDSFKIERYDERFSEFGWRYSIEPPQTISIWDYRSIISQKKIRVIEVKDPWKVDSKVLDLHGKNEVKAKRLTHINVNVLMKRKDTDFKWKHPTSIKNLELNGNPTTSYLLEIGSTTTKLERIKSTSPLEYSDEMASLFSANQETLREVNLCGYKCSNNDIQSLSNCKGLQVLSLDCSNITPDSLQLLSKLENLQILKIEVSEKLFSPEDIIEFLTIQNKLQTLSLRYNGRFNDSIMDALTKLPHLNDLTLSSHGISDVTDRGFFNLVSHCINLERLILYIPIHNDWKQDEEFGSIDWLTLQPPNLKYLLTGNIESENTNIIKTMMRPFSSLRCWLYDDTLFLKSATTWGETFSAFEPARSILSGITEVVMF